MQNDFLLIFRLLSAGVFAATLLLGAYLAMNYEKIFGVDSNMPSETGSSRSYSRLQVFSVWAHAVCLTGGFAWLLH